MTEIKSQEYLKNFERVYEYFKKNIHNLKEYQYEVIQLPDTFLKMILVFNKKTKKQLYRCIIYLTQYDIPQFLQTDIYKETVQQYTKFFNIREFNKECIEQIYIIQLDKNFEPITHSDPLEYRTIIHVQSSGEPWSLK
jgi:hypothetical protein